MRKEVAKKTQEPCLITQDAIIHNFSRFFLLSCSKTVYGCVAKQGKGVNFVLIKRSGSENAEQKNFETNT